MGDLPDYTKYVINIPAPPSPELVTNPKKYEGTVAVVGTPATLNVNTDLGRNSGDGYIVCDGPGDLEVDLSDDGITFEEDISIKENETFDLGGLNTHTIKIDATSNGTAYRVLVV